MELPKKVKIGPYQFALERTYGMDTIGIMNYDRQRIAIDPDIPQDIATDTTMHEILHVIFYMSGLRDDFEVKEQERIVNTFATPLIQVIRDNPKLIEYIVGS